MKLTQPGLRLVPDECVDFGDVNVVQLLDRVFDLVLVGLDVHDEHKCVVVLNLLHGGLCCQGELDDGIMIQPTGGKKIGKKPNPHTCLVICFCFLISTTNKVF